MAAIELQVSTGTALVHSADFIADSIITTLPDAGRVEIPFLWTPTTVEADVVAGIDAWIADPGITVERNGTGLVIPLPSPTHPAAEITGHDMDANLLQFRWVDGPYSGDCAISFEFTTSTTAADLVAAIVAVVS